jgi:hypothetical protein
VGWGVEKAASEIEEYVEKIRTNSNRKCGKVILESLLRRSIMVSNDEVHEFEKLL